jgi:anti-sigma factor RsiW
MSTPHLDDEAFSAALDGTDQPALAHVAGCDECAARLAEFEAVRAAVAGPVPPPDPAARDRAVAAALAAFSQPVPITLAPRRRRLPRPAVLAAAAAIIVIVVAVPVLVALQNRSPSTSSKNTFAAGGAAAGPIVNGGDLGSQQDPQALGALVKSAVTSSGNAADSGATVAQSQSPSGGPAAASGTQPSTAEAQPQGPLSQPRAASAPTPCESPTRTKYGQGIGALVYTATLTWQGKPAVLYAYNVAAASGSFRYRVFVVDRATCDLLTVLSL